MKKAAVLCFLLCMVVQFLIAPSSSYCQRLGYTKEEFMRRRAELMKRVEEGMIILFGNSMPGSSIRFRQDNDFYYLSGVEDLGAVMILIPEGQQSFLFLPKQSSREIMVSGANLLEDPQGAEKTGFTRLYPVSYLDEFIARLGTRNGNSLHVRLSPPDLVDNSGYEVPLLYARRYRNHYDDQMPLESYRVEKLRRYYPYFTIKDVKPFIDQMRVIKSEEEIAVLRRNGRISALGVKEAMRVTCPGMYEYELEAAASHIFTKNGARGNAYPAIVGSGPNTCVWHYEANSRKMKAGELVLMDFGADLDYLCIDITRTWPVSGRFTPEQREVYEIVLTVLKACIEAYKPGVTSEDVQRHVAEVMKKKGLDPRGLRGGIGHYVGMSVHDVGPRGIPLQPGMCFAIEPALYYPDKNMGIRIEDTILITESGCEVLSAEVPKEIEEIDSLIQGRSSATKGEEPSKRR
ncbi:MAG: aminopeptidase P N-terminal domain-containing protein [Acidobacteriota bacterium]